MNAGYEQAFLEAARMSRRAGSVTFVLESNGEYIAVDREDVRAFAKGPGPYIVEGGRIVYSFDNRS